MQLHPFSAAGGESVDGGTEPQSDSEGPGTQSPVTPPDGCAPNSGEPPNDDSRQRPPDDQDKARNLPLAESQLSEIEKRLGYVFKDRGHLCAALVHSSAKEDGWDSNERMEFLGDSVIGMVVSQLLYERLPLAQEGEMSAIKSVVVSCSSLSVRFKALGVTDFLVLGRGIAKRKHLPDSVLTNVFEAIVAAVYLDGELPAADAFVRRAIGPLIESVIEDNYEKNYKSLLQQYSQQALGCIPRYRVLRETGPDHEKQFEAIVELADREFGSGWGRTKKDAEQQAARLTLQALNVLKNEKKGKNPDGQVLNSSKP
ncbi:MAG: ribonuclease III [Planctomycetota bacterium]|nr:ribonuclease III [Planctomycetota bacterium]